MLFQTEYERRVDIAARRFGRELTPLVASSRQIAANQLVLAGHQAQGNEHLGGLLATTRSIDATLQQALGVLAGIQGTLDAIALMLRTPAQTAANEKRDNGIRALANGWTDEAITDLREATSAHVYDAVSHFFLAHALLAREQAPEALIEYELATRYGVAEAPPVGAGAALRGAIVAEALGDEARGLRMLDAVVERVGWQACPSVHLAIAIRRDDADHLAAALCGDPALLVDAAAAEASHIDPAATRATTESWRPRLDAAIAALHQAAKAFEPTNKRLRVTIPALPRSTGASGLIDTVDALDAAVIQLREADQAFRSKSPTGTDSARSRALRWGGGALMPMLACVLPFVAFITIGNALYETDRSFGPAMKAMAAGLLLALAGWGVAALMQRRGERVGDSVDAELAQAHNAVRAAIVNARPSGLIDPW